jgi:hypothetical protein
LAATGVPRVDNAGEQRGEGSESELGLASGEGSVATREQEVGVEHGRYFTERMCEHGGVAHQL